MAPLSDKGGLHVKLPLSPPAVNSKQRSLLFQAWQKCFIDGREIFIRDSNVCGLANKRRESESCKKKFVTALAGGVMQG